MSTENKPAEPPAPEVALENIVLEIQEVRYSLPQMMRELQLERTQSYFSKEIIDQIEISKIFAQARRARAKGRKH